MSLATRNDDFKDGFRRVFAAIVPPPAVQSELYSLSGRIASALENVKLRRVPEENLHITLRFMGEASEPDVADLQKNAESVAKRQTPFILRVGELGVFRNRGGCAVWVGVSEIHQNKTSSKLAEIACELSGDVPKRFVPHLTIGRSRSKIRRISSDIQVAAMDFTVNEILVFESVLKPTGAEYRIISRHPFYSQAT